jgi:hypothetical protein
MINALTRWVDQRIDHAARVAAIALYKEIRVDLLTEVQAVADRIGLDDIERLATEITAQLRRVFPFLVLDPRTVTELDAAERFEKGDTDVT